METAITPITRIDPFLYQPRDLQSAINLATILSKSTIIPGHLRGKPEDVLLQILKGTEFGLPVVMSLESFYVVSGKVEMYADTCVALALRHPDICKYFMLVEDESNDTQAVYETMRVGDPRPQTFKYTMQMAERAGLLRNSVWKTHPAAMLRARAAMSLARIKYPDIFLGTYERDEAREIEAREVNPPPSYKGTNGQTKRPEPEDAVTEEPNRLPETVAQSTVQTKEEPRELEHPKESAKPVHLEVVTPQPEQKSTLPGFPAEADIMTLLSGAATENDFIHIRKLIGLLPTDKQQQFVAPYVNRRRELRTEGQL